MQWFREHKTQVGSVATGISAALAYAGYTEAAAVVLTVGGFLVGGGLLKSDREAKRDA